MKVYVGIVCILCVGIWSCNQSGSISRKSSLSTVDDSISYAIGMDIGKTVKDNLMDNGVGLDGDVLAQAMVDAIRESEDMLLDDASVNRMIMVAQQQASSMQQQKMMQEAEENLAAGQAYLEDNKTQEGVVELESGLQYKILESGDGNESPNPDDEVVVHYEGKLLNGEVFDSSYERGEPVPLQVNQVIAGWTEALQLMVPGDKWELYIPSQLAYGNRGSGGVIGPNATLIFQVELLEVSE